MTELLPGERLRCVARPHWIVLVRSLGWIPPVVGAGVLVSLSLHAVPLLRGAEVWAPPVFLLGLVVGAGGAGGAFVSWSSRFVLVTDRRAIQQSGVVRRRRTMIPLDRIQDVTTERGLLGALLGYGDIIVTTAGLPLRAPARERNARNERAVARPSLVLGRVRTPDLVARSLFPTGLSGMLDDHDELSKAAGAARLHGRRQVDGGPSGGGAGRRGVRRPRPAHRA
ncbi:MAG: PH domain-containing protein [Candidatus Dormibacteraeota bacterium]|nr:PH domain-containing protein [Candidatus Dormibacteraeota bacterium]